MAELHVRVVYNEKDLDRFPAQFEFCINAWTATELLLYEGLFKGLIFKNLCFCKKFELICSTCSYSNLFIQI